MNENKQKNSRRRLNSLILLVAFTAIMLIVSTYAWFSTQKNVSLSGLEGTVKVAEGLQISLDATKWVNGIDFKDFTEQAFIDAYVPGATLEHPYQYLDPEKSDGTKIAATNVLPDELLPVSTTGAGDDISTKTMAMYEGTNVNGNQLYNITKKTEEKASGYYAIDLFLQNSSKSTVTVDPLQLQAGSTLTLKSSTKNTTGLQNTVRVALVQYANSNDEKVKVDSTPSAENIIAGTTNTAIDSVAIWEPNANAHVQYIVDSNNNVTWKKADVTGEKNPLKDDVLFKDITWASDTEKKIKFGLTSQVPTYALTATALTTKELDKTTDKIPELDDKFGSIKDIYNWGATASAGLAKQTTLQTTTAGIDKDTLFVRTVNNTDGSSNFTIPGGQYVRMRMYIWLEGQDVDCTNYASLGGGIKIDFGFSKTGSQS